MRRLGVRDGGFCALVVAAAWAGPVAAADYNVEFRGAPDDLRSSLEIVSSLGRGARDYPTLPALAIAARRDIKELENALQAAGYYAGAASFEIEDADPPQVIFQIEPGPKFSISDYRIVYTDDGGAQRPQSLEAAGVAANGSAAGKQLQAAQQAFLRHLWAEGYPSAQIVARRADARLEEGTATAVFTFESGPRAHFGELEVEGATHTDERYLEKLKTWEDGALFDRTQLVEYRDELSKTGLFTRIDVAPGAPGADGAAPVRVTLDERKRRTIGAGVSYSTAEGPGGRLFFEYRNLFHQGERARTEIEASEIEQSVAFTFDKPMPLFPGSAFAQFDFRNETTDAFDARTVALAAGLSRRWLEDRLETRAGLGFETSRVRTETTDERTYFVLAPLSAVWNTEDDILNPSEGVRAALTVTPHTGSRTFTRSELNARSRVAFGADDRFTLAARGRIGATFGVALDDLPSNKRFFAGGGSSVRGYDFQAVGPLNPEGDPIGGRSVVEAAVEARVRVIESLQAAAFADSGIVSQSALPDFSDDLFVGVGGGLRYLSPIGPIRVDAAFPLEKRESDRAFQIYISLGQPF